MSSLSNIKVPREVNSSNTAANGINFEQLLSSNGGADAKHRAILAEWLSSLIPSLSLSQSPSDEQFRACLIDGTVLCQILNKLRPGLVKVDYDCDNSQVSHSENVKRFLSAMDGLGLPRFEISDLEKGSMKAVMDCLLTLRAQSLQNAVGGNFSKTSSKSDSPHGDSSPHGPFSPLSGEEKRKVLSESKCQRVLRSPMMSEPSAALIHHVGHKFHEVFQLKQGRYADLPAAKISEMMKSNSLDNAPTQSLLSVVNGILDESVEKKNGEIPHRVACLLRKVVQEVERRISTQAEHLRTQSNLFKAREEKYQSRIRVLEVLASGTKEDSEIVLNGLQQMKSDKVDEKKKVDDEDVMRLMKENDLKNIGISALQKELETTRNTYEVQCLKLEAEAKGAKMELEQKSQDFERLLADTRTKVEELEAHSVSKHQRWNMKENIYKTFMDFQFGSLRELRLSFESIKQEILKAQRSYSEDFNQLGVRIKALANAAENYNAVLVENRRLFNEVQELKGNIRVFCRIRPFLPGQKEKNSIVQYIGENGELVVANPSKQGKEGHRQFKFNKVFGPASTQVEVFSDIEPLIRSVLDGYNVCIFAYGQTGSGKTHTMTGPKESTKETWGVNYRALNDLFNISQSRKSSLTYEIGVQMVEIYNEQHTLGILTQSQPSGLAVPDASMHAVTSTADVMELMETGLRNRAVGATAMNERSSRSHSVVTIHVRGMDLKTSTSLHGNLHLVDLAGSERVDRSEVTGDRLREAQHINKSLSALGDVIFALAQKSPHVPYRNSKLTQLLQSSLGGHAKTLMFVQLNPDMNSFSESLSTLKFAERVSGIELGAARSSKEGRDVRELMEQVASLKDTISDKDEEIDRLQLLKDLKNAHPGLNSEKRGTGSLRYGSLSPSPKKDSVGGTVKRSQIPSSGKGFGLTKKAASDDNNSDHSDKHSEDSQQSMDDFNHQNEILQQSKVAGGNIGQSIPADAEILGNGDADYEERLSDISDSGLSVGTETDGSSENTNLIEGKKVADKLEKPRSVSKIVQALQKQKSTSTTMSASRDSRKVSPGIKRSPSGGSLQKPPRKWQ
ncbi:Kinesin-like protein [Quillaja saponaria]|uniref:Kinesin-like protein n=1 Tax=Quillaja saponaria TaxID=32244 RepID=A0AAD7PWH1_QUISA|nr:Kinesin-like protein [Quillaja saponaria]